MKSAPLALLGLLLALTQPAPARADVATVDSLATLVDASPLIVVATVTAAKQQDGREYLLTLALHETLKGGGATSFTLAAHDASLVGARALIFTTAPRPVSTADCYGVPHTLPYLGRALVGDPSAWTLPSRDFGLHVGAAAIAAAIRARAVLPSVQRAVAVPVPAGTPLAAHEAHARGGLLLRVPADDELEAWLLAELAAPETARRVQALLMLEPFESVPNIRRLLALIDDPSQVTDPDGTQRFWVREAARHTLGRWDVPLPAGPPTVTPAP